jgi:hypothetical protein
MAVPESSDEKEMEEEEETEDSAQESEENGAAGPDQPYEPGKAAENAVVGTPDATIGTSGTVASTSGSMNTASSVVHQDMSGRLVLTLDGTCIRGASQPLKKMKLTLEFGSESGDESFKGKRKAKGAQGKE